MQHDYNGFPGQSIAHEVAAKFPGRAKVVTHKQWKLLMPLFTTVNPSILRPDSTRAQVASSRTEPVLRDVGTKWDIAKHADVRKPVSLGQLTSQEQRSLVSVIPEYARHVLDMPIKFPGTDVRLPAELASLAPVVQRIIDAEAAVNPEYDKYLAYISVQQGPVVKGGRHRENPYHVDGFQGPRWKEKHPTNHSYLVCDMLPTDFFPRPFPLNEIDPAFDDIYAEFGRVIESDPNGPIWRPKDFELILMDAYCVHRGAVADCDMFRTWVRVSWETRKFDRLGNTHNPLFDYNWDMVARDTDPRIRPRQLAVAA